MKTKLLSGIVGIMGLALLNLTACNDDPVDQSAPTIELSEPGMNEIFAAGDHVHFEAVFEDDVELGTYNVEIHDNSDGHSHGRVAAWQTDPSLIKWYFDESFEFPSGETIQEVLFEDEIQVAENALAGPYHFIVQAIDKAGNATAFDDDSAVEIQILIANNSQPDITISNLEEGELRLEAGVLFQAEGDVTDPTIGTYAGMHAVNITLGEGELDHDHNHGGRLANEDLIDVSYEKEQLEAFMTDGVINLGAVFEDIGFVPTQSQIDELKTADIDHLDLMIMVHDEQGNIGVSITPVHFD
jgi:hypothetical protein